MWSRIDKSDAPAHALACAEAAKDEAGDGADALESAGYDREAGLLRAAERAARRASDACRRLMEQTRTDA